MHAYTRTYKHTYIHTYIHTTFIHTYIHTCICSLRHIDTLTHRHTYIQTHRHTDTRIHSLRHAERDNVVYWKTNGKINNDLLLASDTHMYTDLGPLNKNA